MEERKEVRALTENIMERIVEHVNLNRAYQQVVGNRGASGVDEMDIEGFKQWYVKGINPLREALLSEEYKVSPVRKVEITKASGGIRVLGNTNLIKAYLTAGMMEGGLTTQRMSGTPQGGPLSPLVSRRYNSVVT